MVNTSKLLPVTIDDIREAKHILKNNSRITPLIKSFYLTGISGGQVYLKLENMQLTGSFKFRGAYNKIAHLTEDQKEKGVIACSAGNHAQGVALSCHLLGIKSKIVMPLSAPKAKIAATEGYGAEVVLYGDSFDEAKKRSLEIQEETGETFVAPYDDAYVMAGQGTIGLEILDEFWDVDTVIVPVGGGGLISGVAVALKAFNPSINVIGVQSENVHGMASSFKEGKITPHKEGSTIADGCAVETPGTLTFEVVNELVTDIILVSDADIELAMKDLIQRTKVVVEGAGALATAAILSGKADKYVKNQKVVAVISGGNVDLSRISDIMGHFLNANELTK